MDDKIIEILYLADEFCKEFEKTIEKHSVDQNNGKKRRKKALLPMCILLKNKSLGHHL